MKSAKMRFGTAFLYVMFVLMILGHTTSPAAAPTVFRYYWVTLGEKSPRVTFGIGHSTVGWEWNFTYEARWGWGENEGEIIPNATIPIEVYDVADENNIVLVNNFLLTTDNVGRISFVYSSPTPRVLRLRPTKLITQDGVEYNSSLYYTNYPGGTPPYYSLYGFSSTASTIYWDDFDISLVDVDVNQLGTSKVTVNLTYQMIPAEGIWLTGGVHDDITKYIPKYVSNASVTVNGVTAAEISPGLYEAQVSTWLPTADFHVKVSKSGWIEGSRKFSFVHNANQVVWVAVSLSLTIVFATLLLYYFLFVRRRRTSEHAPKTQSAIARAPRLKYCSQKFNSEDKLGDSCQCA